MADDFEAELEIEREIAATAHPTAAAAAAVTTQQLTQPKPKSTPVITISKVPMAKSNSTAAAVATASALYSKHSVTGPATARSIPAAAASGAGRGGSSSSSGGAPVTSLGGGGFSTSSGGGGGSSSGAGKPVADRLTAALAPYLTSIDHSAPDSDRAANRTYEYAAGNQKKRRTNQHSNASAAATATDNSTSGGGGSAATDDSPPPNCVECSRMSYSRDFHAAFGIAVCIACTKRPALSAKYAVMTKTEAKTRYLLTEPDFAGLPFISKPNTKHASFGHVKLYRTQTIIEVSDKRYGDAAKREEEKAKRELKSLERRVSAQRKKRRIEDDATAVAAGVVPSDRVITPAVLAATAPAHSHSFGESTPLKPGATDGVMKRTCTECGFVDQFEDL